MPDVGVSSSGMVDGSGLDSGDITRCLRESIPEPVASSVALAVLSDTRTADVDVLGYRGVYDWSGTGVECLLFTRVKRSNDTDLLRESQRIGILVMRCLPKFRHHPLLRLVPKQTCALPRELLPSDYVERFKHDPTQLDGGALFKYHLDQHGYFQLPHSGPAFRLSWSQLWTALKAGRIL